MSESLARLAREAVELIRLTDFLDLQADTLVHLAEILLIAGRSDASARTAIREAVGRYVSASG